MTTHRLTRRALLEGAAALGAAGCLPARLAAQPARAEPLPARGEFVIRGATVLTMDERLGDFASGAVHIRDGAIAAVGENVDVPGADVIDGSGMICMPGFVDTHWHLWISMLRPFVRADIGELSVFPVSTRLGQHMTPQDAYRQRQARHRGGAERGRDHGAQLGAQHAQPRARRRRALAPCATPASAAASPTARRRACRTTSRWTSLASRASSATGCRATACSRSASARAMSAAAASAAARAASYRPTWRKRTGTAPARSGCRSPCTRQARARSRRSSRPACSAPTCSSCTRC